MKQINHDRFGNVAELIAWEHKLTKSSGIITITSADITPKWCVVQVYKSISIKINEFMNTCYG